MVQTLVGDLIVDAMRLREALTLGQSICCRRNARVRKTNAVEYDKPTACAPWHVVAHCWAVRLDCERPLRDRRLKRDPSVAKMCGSAKDRRPWAAHRRAGRAGEDPPTAAQLAHRGARG